VQYAAALRGEPAAAVLPDGYRIADDRARAAHAVHPLARRNGAQIAERLSACDDYRRDFDLQVLDERGSVAAYCVVWFDALRQVALFEPMRTEEAHLRRGLARALVQDGLQRAHAAGARWAKVSSLGSNTAARRLCEAAGFTPVLRKLGFRYVPRA
jgi:GNAT superfamily N-acetyltransferase